MKRKPVNNFIKKLTYDHSVKIGLGLAVLIALLAQTPVEYFVSAGLALMAYLDYEDGAPLI